MERTQFTFYESFFRAITRIREDAHRAAAYDAVCAYALYGTLPDLEALPDAVAIAFELIRPNLDASRRKAEGGKKGKKKEETGKMAARCAKEDAHKKETETETEHKNEIEKEVEDECPGRAVNAPGDTDAVLAVLADYQSRINPAASAASLEELRTFAAELGAEVCRRAFDIALDNQKPTWPYIRAILRHKAANGVTTLARWDALEQQRAAEKSRPGRSEAAWQQSAEEREREMDRYVLEMHRKVRGEG